MSERVVLSKDDPAARALRSGIDSLRSSEVSAPKKALIASGMALAIGYVLFPVDVIPDAAPIVGMLDDWGAMVAAMLPTVNTLKSKIDQPGLTGWEKILLAVGGGYALFPVDVIPDAIPVAGTADDLGFMMAVFLPWFMGQVADRMGGPKFSSRTSKSDG